MAPLEDTIEALANDALRCCGLVWELFVQRFSEAVDDSFPPSSPQREEALRIATEKGYASVEEREQTQKELAADGCCSHGLAPDCCPLGCGDTE